MNEIKNTKLSTSSLQTNSVTDPENYFQPLAQSSIFWHPSYLESSACLEHLPFAFWLIEAHEPKIVVDLGSHNASSYFAFCQAVDKLGLDTQCFAINTWNNDISCDNEVFEKINKYNKKHYYSFSRIVRSNLDKATCYFADGTIDLLHIEIDNFHTLDDARHIFNTWLPKLSMSAVIVMHNINVDETSSTAFKLYEQLHTLYPAFKLIHGHGLGVLGIGKNQKDILKRFFNSNKNKVTKHVINNIFSRLGKACSDSFEATQQHERAQKLTEKAKKQTKQLEEYKKSIEKTKTDLSIRTKELTEARTRMQTQIEHHAVERGQLVERSNLLQEIRTELKEEMAKQQVRIESTSAKLYRHIEEVSRLEQLSNEHNENIKSVKAELKAQKQINHSLKEEVKNHELEAQTYENRLIKKEQELENSLINQKALSDENENIQQCKVLLEQNNGSYKEQITSIRAELQTQKQANISLAEEVKTHKIEAQTYENRLIKKEQELENSLINQKALSDENENIQQCKVLLEQDNGSCKEQLASVRTELKVQQQTNLRLIEKINTESKQLKQEITTLGGDKDRLICSMETRFKEITKLTQMMKTAEKKWKQSSKEVTTFKKLCTENEEKQSGLQAKLEAQTLNLEVKSKEFIKQTRQLEIAKKDSKQIEREKKALQAKKDNLESNMEIRFEELAKLTKILKTTEKELKQFKEEKDVSKKSLIWSKLLFTNSTKKSSRRKEKRKFAHKIQRLRKSGLFDETWYLDRYPDIRKSKVDPVEHYLRFGAFEGWDPNPAFSTISYLEAYPDVAASNINPLLHYVEYGQKEGREIQNAKEIQ